MDSQVSPRPPTAVAHHTGFSREEIIKGAGLYKSKRPAPRRSRTQNSPASRSIQRPLLSRRSSSSSHQCSCGDDCRCFPCASHPRNRPTLEAIQFYSSMSELPDSVVASNGLDWQKDLMQLNRVVSNPNDVTSQQRRNLYHEQDLLQEHSHDWQRSAGVLQSWPHATSSPSTRTQGPSPHTFVVQPPTLLSNWHPTEPLSGRAPNYETVPAPARFRETINTHPRSRVTTERINTFTPINMTQTSDQEYVLVQQDHGGGTHMTSAYLSTDPSQWAMGNEGYPESGSAADLNFNAGTRPDSSYGIAHALLDAIRYCEGELSILPVTSA